MQKITYKPTFLMKLRKRMRELSQKDDMEFFFGGIFSAFAKIVFLHVFTVFLGWILPNIIRPFCPDPPPQHLFCEKFFSLINIGMLKKFVQS